MPEEEAEKNQAEKPDARPSEHRRVANYTHGYSNYAEIGLTPWDIRITFSNMIEATDDKVIFDDLATIIMHPGLAKVLLNVLASNLKGYESQYGKIQLPNINKGGKKANVEAKDFVEE